MKAAVHQLLPTFSLRDAIGGHVLAVQTLLRDLGVDSEIYAERAGRGARRHCRHYRRLRSGTRPTWLLYHASTGSELAEFVLARREPRIVDYHNITPPELLAPWEPQLAHGAAWGRRQLRRLASWSELGIADSVFNERELAGFGFAPTGVAPLLVDVGRLDGDVDEATADRLRRSKEHGGSDWLFVGRVTPHKAQHDVVRAFAVYRETYDPQGRLHLIGSATSLYAAALTEAIAELGLQDAVRMPGSVSDPELAAYYRAADVFVCLSDHEGFCVPLVEAMHLGVPVVAYAAGAVPETVGRAGELLTDKRPGVVASAVIGLLTDPDAREASAARGREQAERFSLDSSRRRFADALGRVL